MRHADKKIISKKTTAKRNHVCNGKLYGIGLGPGDPSLLTIKARNILRKIDVIFAPKAGIESASLAANIIRSHIKNENKIRELVFPMTKDKNVLKKFWNDAAKTVCKEISSGRNAAFITLGDPFIYSTFCYLLREVKKIDPDINVTTIPGISSINAASSLLETPLVEGNEKFIVMPLPKDFRDIKKALSFTDTVVLLKIGNHLDRLCAFLRQNKLDQTTFFARRIGLQGEYAAKNISSLSKEVSGYLSIAIIKSPKTGKIR